MLSTLDITPTGLHASPPGLWARLAHCLSWQARHSVLTVHPHAGIECEVLETERRDHAKDIMLEVVRRQLGSLDGVVLVSPLLTAASLHATAVRLSSYSAKLWQRIALLTL